MSVLLAGVVIQADEGQTQSAVDCCESRKRRRLSTSVKLPSKSPSILPVSVSFFDMSGHSKFIPKRVERALTWTSGSFGWAGVKSRVAPGIQPYAGKREVIAIGVAAVVDDRRLNKAVRRKRDRARFYAS
jgi:hypothetical protein